MTVTLRDNIGAIVLFSGPGGSSLGLRNAGITRSIGVEYEANAVATARAAGFKVVHADVRTLDPNEVLGRLSLDRTGFLPNEKWDELLLQSSPPCQGLSMAGKGVGRKDLEHLLGALQLLGQMPMSKAKQWTRWYTQMLMDRCADERSPLTFETMRWICDLEPEYISLEQVPTALPIWLAIGAVLEGWGYSWWAGNVQAEQFGVPQTRKRAILLAAKMRGVDLTPSPTHSRYYSRDPQKLDPGVPKWVSMAEALGYGEAVYRSGSQEHATVPDSCVPAPTIAFGHDAASARWEQQSNYSVGGDLSTRGHGDLAEPSSTITSKSMRWIEGVESLAGGAWEPTRRDADEPALTVTGSGRNVGFAFIEPEPAIDGETVADVAWVHTRPSPTMVGSFHPEVVAKPGYRKAGDPPRQKTPGSVRVTVEEAGVLQSFPVDYPWQGTKTRQYGQVGNAVPPLLQQRLTEQLLARCDTESQRTEQAA